jgi:RimJ/RimL family protein N-acetyltransferase
MVPAGRFILRPYRHSDAAEMSAAVRESTETVGRWMSWAKADFNEYDAACWFDHCSQASANGSAHEFGIFGLDGSFVGGCGLNQFSVINKLCNLGYWVRQSRQRNGAAAAAVLALRDLGLIRLGMARIEIVVAVDNVASIGVARKSGATHECVARSRLQVHGKPTPAHVFSFTHDTDA